MQLSESDLLSVFDLKYGDRKKLGWSPKARIQLGYFTPDEYYEATISKLIFEECSWIDVGSGGEVFPGNRRLAELLANHCEFLLGVDPSNNLDRNRIVHEKVKTTIENFQPDRVFDLGTFRMVAEHISDPDSAVRSLGKIIKIGGKVVVYTVNLWSPVTLISFLVPHVLHHPIKQFLWGSRKEDTFSVFYRMNTRRRLKRIFRNHGFREISFSYLDDCRVFHRYRLLHLMELWARNLLNAIGLHYLDTCLLGVYEKVR